MKRLLRALLLLAASLLWAGSPLEAAPKSLFDGESFAGWNGETQSVWRVEDGVIVGGSLEGNPRNEFLATDKVYKNFRLQFEYRLVGTEGFVNGSVHLQIAELSDSGKRPNVVVFLVDDMGLMDTSVPFLTDASGKPEDLIIRSLKRWPRRRL